MAAVSETDKDTIRQLLDNGESLRSIAKRYGITYQTLQYHRRRWGMPPLRKGFTRGESHKSWRGGTFVDRWGYKFVRSPERDCANPYSHEHIIVAEQKIGRPLKKYIEVVHHIDGNKANNSPDNLLVCNRSEHRKLHRQLEQVGYELIARGFIRFDGGKYVLVK